jgi:hypothetical protein
MKPKRRPALQLSNKQITQFLFAAEGIGAIFVSIFSAAYLLGLPTTEVRHSEPIFRISLSVFGVSFLIFILTAFVLSFIVKLKN